MEVHGLKQKPFILVSIDILAPKTSMWFTCRELAIIIRNTLIHTRTIITITIIIIIIVIIIIIIIIIITLLVGEKLCRVTQLIN